MHLAALLLTGVLAAPATPDPATVDLPALLKIVGARVDQVEATQKRSTMIEDSIIEELDRKSAVVSRSIALSRVSWKDGAPSRELVRYTKDGEDLTEEKRKETGKKKDHQALRNPLGTALQARHRFTIVGPAPEAPGLLRIHFEPAGEPDGATIGEALVDPATGQLHSLSARPAKMPHFVDNVAVKAEFAVLGPGGALMPSIFEMELDSGFWMFRKRVRIHSVMSEYAFGPSD